jgi:hypothetical protein
MSGRSSVAARGDVEYDEQSTIYIGVGVLVHTPEAEPGTGYGCRQTVTCAAPLTVLNPSHES